MRMCLGKYQSTATLPFSLKTNGKTQSVTGQIGQLTGGETMGSQSREAGKRVLKVPADMHCLAVSNAHSMLSEMK